MSYYNPNRWLIVDVGDHYRVLATWSGGYLDGDSWRLNSGITSCRLEDDYYLFSGSSDSIYKCHKGMYGTNLMGTGVLKKYSGKITPMEDREDWTDMDWKIK